MNKRAIVVLGMHRSGTSALVRGIAALGVELGSRLMPPVPEQNARGFFEDVDFVALNDRLLHALGRSWHSLEPVAPEEWQLPALQPLAEEAAALLARRLDEHPLWGMKDPRLARLLPFWQPLLARLGVEERYVIALRNPLSVARSLAVRNGFAAGKAYLLWLGHMLPAVTDSGRRRRVVADYDLLLEQPERELERIAAALGLPMDDGARRGAAEYAEDFLSGRLRHSVFEPRIARDDPRLGPLAGRAYELLHELARGRADDEAFRHEWASIETRFRDFAPTLRYLDECERRIDEMAEPSAATAAEPAPAPAAWAAGAAGAAPAAAGRADICVVIPLYNHGRFIEAAVESVYAQTLAPSQVIVVDDGSTDDSAAAMAVLCQRHPGILFWSQPNQGAHHALNAAIHRATGEFVSILNSDDIYHPRRLEECFEAMRADPAAAAVAAGVTFIDAEGAPLDNPWYAQAMAFYRETGDLPLALARANLLVSTSNLFIRRAAFAEVGYFSPLRYAHDLDFALRLLAGGSTLRLLDSPLLGYRLHGGNTIAESAARVDVERAAVLAMHACRLWRAGAGGAWREFIARLAEVLEDQALTDFVAHFLVLLEGAPRDAAARRLLAAAGGRIEGLPGDWLLRDAAGSPLAELVAARHAALRRRGLPALSGEQQAWMRELEKGRAWLSEQYLAARKSLEAHAATVAEQRAWIDRLEEAKAWLAAQREDLLQRLEAGDARRRAQQAWIDEIGRSTPWRILQALKLAPRPRPDEHRTSSQKEDQA